MQIRTIPWSVCVGVVLALASPGCTDNTSTNTTSGSGGGGGGAGGSEMVEPGHSATETVTAGEVAKSQKYKMIFTLGQPTQNQEKSTSANYRLRGGLVGANGNAP